MTKIYKVPVGSYEELSTDSSRIRSAIDLIDELIALDEKTRKETMGLESALGSDQKCFKVVQVVLHQMELERNARIAILLKALTHEEVGT